MPSIKHYSPTKWHRLMPATIAARIDSQERGSSVLRVSRLSLVAFCVVTGAASLLASTSVPLALQTSATESAKTWLDKRQAMEDYLRLAEVIKIEDIGIGVTKPRRAYLAPGGPFDRMAFKTIKPGYHRGFWESYKSEVAAYELDKVLALDMIPPTVERDRKSTRLNSSHL